jgi:hypothetical protein
MLSPGQFVAWPMKANQAKYCKFAYSSAFGFSVPTGPLIQQIAPDNQLALSRDGGETWAVKWKCDEVKFGALKTKLEDGKHIDVSMASVRWYPWGDQAVAVDTILIPPTDQWPDWHIRMHRIRCNKIIPSLHTVEGGFAIYGRKASNGMNLPTVETLNDETPGRFEGVHSDNTSTIISSEDGVSGISIEALLDRSKTPAESSALKPDSNTNIVRQRTLIPAVSVAISGGLEPQKEVWIKTSVFAISSKASGGISSTAAPLRNRWLNRPSIDVASFEQILHNM